MPQMQHLSQQLPGGHSMYNPFPWIFNVRIAQFVLTILVIALSGYAASQTYLAAGLTFSFWTIVWSLVYVPVAVLVLPKMKPKYRPNIIVLVVECFSWFWWLLAFSLLATFSAAISYDSSINEIVYEEIYGTTYGNLKAVAACVKVATAFAAFNYILFKVTFIAICIRIYKQRKERQAQSGVEAGMNGSPIEVNHMTNDKTTGVHVQTQPVHQF